MHAEAPWDQERIILRENASNGGSFEWYFNFIQLFVNLDQIRPKTKISVVHIKQ